MSRVILAQAGETYCATALVRNHAAYPLGASAYGNLEIVWLDARGGEMSRVSSRAFGSRLPSRKWSKILIRAAEAPVSAVRAMVCVSLYDQGRDGGSIWVSELDGHATHVTVRARSASPVGLVSAVP